MSARKKEGVKVEALRRKSKVRINAQHIKKKANITNVERDTKRLKEQETKASAMRKKTRPAKQSARERDRLAEVQLQ